MPRTSRALRLGALAVARLHMRGAGAAEAPVAGHRIRAPVIACYGIRLPVIAFGHRSLPPA